MGPRIVLIFVLAPAYLLIYGSLPSANQLLEFKGEVMHHGTVHADAEQFCRSFRSVTEHSDL